MKNQKLINIAVWSIIGALVFVVIVTGIILHSKQKKLDDLKQKNEIVTPQEGQETKEIKIFLKNFEIFIDNDLDF